ncbi:hypothetical protein RUM43_001208 [Polyplax serrata]|uniref:Uncharacterized protein n=1 Tax=Polyplax serrata TaxID=468196 RepID=A0AAN8SHC6_POLSC
MEPSRQRVLLETASIAGGATIAVFLVVIACVTLYLHYQRKSKERRIAGTDRKDGPERDLERRAFNRCLSISMDRLPEEDEKKTVTSIDLGHNNPFGDFSITVGQCLSKSSLNCSTEIVSWLRGEIRSLIHIISVLEINENPDVQSLSRRIGSEKDKPVYLKHFTKSSICSLKPNTKKTINLSKLNWTLIKPEKTVGHDSQDDGERLGLAGSRPGRSWNVIRDMEEDEEVGQGGEAEDDEDEEEIEFLKMKSFPSNLKP